MRRERDEPAVARPPVFSGNYAPISFEADAPDLVVRGDMPKDLRGTLYRNGPNPQFAPASCTPFASRRAALPIATAGSEMAGRERRALRSWDHPLTTDPSFAGTDTGVSNTNIAWHDGRLMALEEAHLPFTLDPETLEAAAYRDFAGAMRGLPFTAHPLFPDPDGRPGDPEKARAQLHRWTFDLGGDSDAFEREQIDDLAAEFPRLDERFAGLRCRCGYVTARSGEILGAFDNLACLDLAAGKRTLYRTPEGDACSGPVFVPRSPGAAEGDGWLLATIYRGAENRSDLAVFDATALDAGPVAVAELSHRIPHCFHGNWLPA
jgi:carotenoid cleavage dioxygenase-like enzyme